MTTPRRAAVALASAVVLGAGAASPAYAAAEISHAEATAAVINLGGNAQDSGTVVASYDGTKETKTGTTNPPVSVLGGQDLANFGVLAQEATAGKSGKEGVSAACAGVAGDGGEVAEVGDSECLTPGDNASVTLGSLDLSNLSLVNTGTALDQVNGLSDALADNLAGPINDAVSQVQAQTGDLGVVASFGAIQGFCTADAGGAAGDATLADAKVSVSGGELGDDVDLVNFPANPDPNTPVGASNLSGLADLILGALETDLNTTLAGNAGPLADLTDQLRTQVIDAVLTQAEGNLAPLDENVLNGTLNKQSAPEAGAIHVTALDLNVLPGGEQFGLPALLTMQLGDVVCGPNGVLAPQPTSTPTEVPDIPTSVSAGEAGSPSPSGGFPAWLGLLGLAGLAAASAFGSTRKA